MTIAGEKKHSKPEFLSDMTKAQIWTKCKWNKTETKRMIFL